MVAGLVENLLGAPFGVDREADVVKDHSLAGAYAESFGGTSYELIRSENVNLPDPVLDGHEPFLCAVHPHPIIEKLLAVRAVTSECRVQGRNAASKNGRGCGLGWCGHSEGNSCQSK